MENLIDLLPVYYSRLFPFKDYCDWLSYGNRHTLAKREFSFTLNDDIYVRFLCFRDDKEMQSEVKRLLPHKIDIGAVYNVRPSEQRKCTNFHPVQKEVVFDIDMTDYDEVRTCCTGASVCNKCWRFMTLACKILDAALRSDFGFKHILWVFSGRRGIHCWVCDPVARFLDTQRRSTIAEYLQLISGGEFMKKKVAFIGDSLHHSIRRALDIIEPEFVTMCIEEQKILGTPEMIRKFLDMMPEDEDRKELDAMFKQCSNDVARWNAFCRFVQDKKMARGSKWYQYRYLKEEVMVQYAYPRLDIEVSKGMNHLLKSPFSIHPKTGKICVPFMASTVDKFELDKVPTIITVIDEINQFDAKEKAQENNLDTTKIKDYKKTSLNKYYHIFHQFLWALKETQKKFVTQAQETMEF